MTPFEALFGYQPLVLPAAGEESRVASIDDYLRKRKEVTQQLKQELASAQNHMKQFTDRRRSEREFEVGSKVYLRLRYPHLKSITRGKVTKVSPKCYGSFPIEAKLGKVAYQLRLPIGSLIHPVFYVSLLKKAVGEQPVSAALPLIPVEAGQAVELKVILERRVIYKHGAPLMQVLVRWQGKPLEDSTWKYIPDLLKQFPRTGNLLNIS